MFSSDASEYQSRIHFPGTFLPFVQQNYEFPKRFEALLYLLREIKRHLLIRMLQDPNLSVQSRCLSVNSWCKTSRHTV